MPAFAVTAPHLSPEQHDELAALLMAIPGVDAFFNEEGILGTEVTCPVDVLGRVVARVRDWAASHERGPSRVQFTCPGGKVLALAEHSHEELVAFLAECHEGAGAWPGLTRRLADDGLRT